jgi:hypothetical protein
MKRAFKERELGDRDEDYLLVTREGECYQRLISILNYPNGIVNAQVAAIAFAHTIIKLQQKLKQAQQEIDKLLVLILNSYPSTRRKHNLVEAKYAWSI